MSEFASTTSVQGICRWLTALLFCFFAGCGSTEKIELDAITPDGAEDGQVTINTVCKVDSDCDDSNPCTLDECLGTGVCDNVPAEGQECDDGNACTYGDECTAAGTCAGADTRICDDENHCTEDGCDPKSGCSFKPLNEVLECDGSLCTKDDQCVNGDCEATSVVDCDDPTPDDCTFPVCNSQTGECDEMHNQAAGAPCKDGNPCTDDDLCDEGGICEAGALHQCISQHPCKTAWCNEQAKEGTNPCVMDLLPENTPCDDGSKCTDNDVCLLVGDGAAIQCSGVPVECNDGNPCTLDTCSEEAGCAYENKSSGTPCAVMGDCSDVGICQDGICVAQPGGGCDDGIPCTADECSPDGSCVHTANHALCDDNDSCTDNLCSLVVGCEYPFNNAPCDDGNPCTSNAKCSQGSCAPGVPANCDDNNECTIDSCDPVAGCKHEPVNPGGGPCYTAPESTKNVGNCKEGTGGCQLDGDEVGCAGEVTPLWEQCDGGQDEDCDGKVDEGCGKTCKPYEVEACYAGAGGTQDVGVCRAGYRQCHASGLEWSPCYDQIVPRAEDICNNDLDDDCDGTQADENCGASPAGGIWADWDHGSDETGNGSYLTPYKTINKAKSSNTKLIIVKADADGTTYQEDVSFGSGNHNVVLTTWGPTRPVLEGRLYVVHCYDCTFENLELRYPAPGVLDSLPSSVIDAVHNYRNTFRGILLSAPFGLPSGKNLTRCHHGYDNLFIDIEVEHIRLLADAQGNFSATLLNWHDHGSGTQYVRVRLGSDLQVQGPTPANLSLTYLSLGGYCGNWPKGVSAVRNCRATGVDLDGLATVKSTFRAVDYWCYTPNTNLAGVMVSNNTFSHLAATEVQGIYFNSAAQVDMRVSSNILGPFFAASGYAIGSNHLVVAGYNDIFEVPAPYSGTAWCGPGCITSNPLFANANGDDYHLAPNSPCIDTGDPAFPDQDASPADMGVHGGALAN